MACMHECVKGLLAPVSNANAPRSVAEHHMHARTVMDVALAGMLYYGMHAGDAPPFTNIHGIAVASPS